MAMRNIKRSAVLLFLTFAVMCGCIFAVSAVDGLIDLDREGSISVTIKADSGKEVVDSGSLSLYKVADIEFNEVDGYYYTYTKEFSNCDDALLETPDTAQASAVFAQTAEITTPIATKDVTVDGATFDGLSVGIYLVAQAEDADGFQPINAFTVSVPLVQDNTYIYNVDATPKAEYVDSIPGDEEPPTVTDNPTVSEPTVSNPTSTVSANPISTNGGTTTDKDGTSSTSGAKTGDIIIMCAVGVAVIAGAIGGITVISKRKGGAE